MVSTPLPLLETSVALRRLSPEEAPYPGWLHAETPQTVWVDSELVPEQVWRCDGEEHLLVPQDLAREGRGHAAIIPHCPTRLRDAVRDIAHPGAAVTIAVSLLRAAAEARRHELSTGSWWVDATGRPVLAPTLDGPRWRDEANTLIAQLSRSASAPVADALVATGELLARERWSTTDAAACEEALFRAADPVPLSHASPRTEATEPSPRRAESLRRGTPATPAAAGTWLSHVTDAGWAERVGDAVRAVGAVPAALRERARRRRGVHDAAAPGGGGGESVTAAPAPPRQRRRRAPWLVAAAVAAGVVVVGVLWPEPQSAGSGEPVTASTRRAPAEPTAPTAAASNPAPSEAAVDDGAGPGALEHAAAAILQALTSCADTADACTGVLENPAADLPAGVVTRDAPRTVTLLDEYGGVAVFRVEAPDEPAQILVLVSADGKWLVRDVYDVADQP